jgi:hypothetical protein
MHSSLNKMSFSFLYHPGREGTWFFSIVILVTIYFSSCFSSIFLNSSQDGPAVKDLLSIRTSSLKISIFRKSFLTTLSCIDLPQFSSGSFSVLGFTLRFLIHLELEFVQCDRCRSNYPNFKSIIIDKVGFHKAKKLWHS